MARSTASLIQLPLDWYRQMRGLGVAFDPKFNSWNVFRYDDIVRILNDHATFSSDRPGGPNQPGLPSIVGLDPPRHKQLRALILQAFTPRMVEQLGPRIKEVANRLIDKVAPTGAMDVMADFGYPLPIIIIAEMLGIPVEEQATFRRWSETLISGPRTDAIRGRSAAEERAANLRELNDYFDDQLRQRRVSPRQDLMSRLIAAEIDGQKLTGQELSEFCRLLLIAGYETTACLVGSSVLCLDEHPEVADELRRDPSLMPGAVEELCRCFPSVGGTMRRTLVPTTIAGQDIPAGQSVIVWFGSANYDEAHFPDGDRFDIRRFPNRHIAFGFGIHFCVGAPLARLEMRIALTTLLQRLPRLRRDKDQPLEVMDNPFIFGVRRFPATF